MQLSIVIYHVLRCFWLQPHVRIYSFKCFTTPPPVLSFPSPVLNDGGEVGLETETDRCSGVWCLTCSHSMRSSQGEDVFDSSDSLTMITLSLGVQLKVRGEPRILSKTKHLWDIGTKRLKNKPQKSAVFWYLSSYDYRICNISFLKVTHF